MSRVRDEDEARVREEILGSLEVLVGLVRIAIALEEKDREVVRPEQLGRARPVRRIGDRVVDEVARDRFGRFRPAELRGDPVEDVVRDRRDGERPGRPS